jgi:hypothetical protein
VAQATYPHPQQRDYMARTHELMGPQQRNRDSERPFPRGSVRQMDQQAMDGG